MHELSIVMNILEIVEESAAKNGAVTVSEIEMDIGELAGIEFDAFDFAVENAPKSDLLKDALFRVHRIKPVARCNDCLKEFPASGYSDPCPFCKSFRTEIIKGNELKVKSFSME